MYLSKSKYCNGMKCPKILWLDKNMPEQYDQSVDDESRFAIGNEVGDLAMAYFGDYTEVLYTGEFNEMITKTQELLEVETAIITEATFAYDGDLCMVDILRKVEGGYEIIEVKSSTNSTSASLAKIKETYFDDMAYQTYILTNCGLTITKVFLMQLNSDYVFQDKLVIAELFVVTDCSEEVFAMQGAIAGNIKQIKSIVDNSNEPVCLIGSNCDKPYECGYKKWCFKALPENNVFTIGWRMSGNMKDRLYQANTISFEDVFHSGVKLTDKQFRQISSTLNNLPPEFDKEAIGEFLDQLKYPLYFLDFETFQQVIPKYNGIKPYSQIPFQYSLHIQEKKDGPLQHKEFLAEAGADPRRAIAESLCQDIPINSCILAYNMAFEKSCIKELAQQFPDLKFHLMALYDNFVDLAQPFASGAYYTKAMAGSYSIKAVLPALCPDDPELDYHNLSLIHNGSEAMEAYATLHLQSPEVIEETRQALLAYCCLDTLAMVKILEKLYQCLSA